MPNELKPCRDRLIELMKQGENITPCADDEDYDCKGVSCEGCVRGAIADHLLANGVIVPPCKVGDTVYDISEFYDGTICPEMYEYKVNHIDLLIDGKFEIEFIPYPDEAWGKTLFFTKEEAEAKLKEMKGNG